jgi:hypothetical protein
MRLIGRRVAKKGPNDTLARASRKSDFPLEIHPTIAVTGMPSVVNSFRAATLAVLRLDPRQRFGRRCKYSGGTLRHDLPSLGQPVGAGRADHQLQAKGLLQCRHMLADGRGRQAQPPRRNDETAGLG